jgi:hypothetical protein
MGAVRGYAREAELLKTLPGFGDVTGWLGAIGPVPHQHFAAASRLASWATLSTGNYMSARKSKGGRTGDGGAYTKPLLIQAAWAPVRIPGGCGPQVRRPEEQGRAEAGDHRTAHTLLKIAYSVLKTGKPYVDPGAGFYTRRESPMPGRTT